MNKVILIGRLTSEPELRYTQNGNAVALFTVAINRYKGDEADFIPVVAWNATAENCAKHLGKGSQVAVEGRLQVRKYEDRNGNKRTATEVVASSVVFLNTRKTDPAEQAADMFNGEISDDDVPF